MGDTFSLDNAKQVIENGIAEAQEVIKNPSKVNDLLQQLEEKVKQIPAIGTTLADLPLMVSMVKSYITREYTEVSPKVIATVVSAVIYVVKKKDLIPDSIPVIGIVDDVAVITFALKFIEPELKAYSAWRDGTTAI